MTILVSASGQVTFIGNKDEFDEFNKVFKISDDTNFIFRIINFAVFIPSNFLAIWVIEKKGLR